MNPSRISSKLSSIALVTALPRLFSPDSFVPKMGLRPMKVLNGLPVEASMSRTSTLDVAKETSSSDVSLAFEASRLNVSDRA